jgi:hypothetical protein
LCDSIQVRIEDVAGNAWTRAAGQASRRLLVNIREGVEKLTSL